MEQLRGPYSERRSLRYIRQMGKLTAGNPDGPGSSSLNLDDYNLANAYFEHIKREIKKGGKILTEKEMKKFVVTPEMWEEGKRYYREHKAEMLQAAFSAREQAVSHRKPPFKVGCAVLGIEPNGSKPKYGIYKAYNFKLKPGSRVGENKKCSERGGMKIAEIRAKVVVAILTVCSELNTGDPTKASGALHPCQDCRNMYRELLKKGIIREDTIICSANDADGEIITEEKTLKELLALYSEDLAA